MGRKNIAAALEDTFSEHTLDALVSAARLLRQPRGRFAARAMNLRKQFEGSPSALQVYDALAKKRKGTSLPPAILGLMRAVCRLSNDRRLCFS